MKSSDITLTDDNIIEYNRKMLPAIQDKEPIYSVVSRAHAYNIKGGENIEIGVYLTGLGIPDANKLVLLWSSPNIIDASSTGVATYCIKAVNTKLNGENMIAPIANRELLEHHKLDPTGVMISLNKGYFLPTPKFPTPQGEELLMPQIIAETSPNGYLPMSISLKTSRKAKSGDYEIQVTFTYEYQNVIKQAFDKVKFHITSWWERNQWWIITLGSIIAFILLVLQSINTWFLAAN